VQEDRVASCIDAILVATVIFKQAVNHGMNDLADEYLVREITNSERGHDVSPGSATMKIRILRILTCDAVAEA
jgi:hypothetical protein